MNYMTIKDAAKLWQISERRIRQLIQDGRIDKVIKVGNTWAMPEDTLKPIDKRYRLEEESVNYQLDNSVMRFIKENESYFQDFITRSTYHSNAIEGNTLTYAETYALLFNDNTFMIDKKTPREIYEAINHKKAMEFVFEKIESDYPVLTIGFIRNLGIMINESIAEIEGFRKVQVIIMGAPNIPPSPEKVPDLMNYFVGNYNNDITENIFEKIAKYHIEYEAIHPFQDGNGRTGRLLINYELIKSNKAPAVIDVENRNNYYELLRTKNVEKLAKWLEDLSNQELERMRYIGYKG